MYTMTINLPNLPKGADVEIDGLGLFSNGSTYEIEPEEADAFRQKHQKQVSEYSDDGQMTVAIELGPTLLEAFKGHEHITVETKKDEKKKGENN